MSAQAMADALAHPSGEGADLLVHRAGEAHGAEDPPHLVVAHGPVGQLLQDGDVVDDVEGGEPGVEGGVLREVAEPTPDGGALVAAGGIEAEELDLPGRGAEHGRQHPQQGGLAGPVGTEEPDDAALVDAQVEVSDGHVAAEPTGEACGGDDGAHAGPP